MIFYYTDYKRWVNDKVTAMPKNGRGQYKKMAEYIGASSTIITQIFKDERDLTPEQAVHLSNYFGLSKIERQYFLLLVNYSRAGSHHYKKILEDEIKELQERSQELKNRVHQNKELTDEAKAILYSNWYYLAIWSLTAIPEFDNLDLIIERLNISRAKANQALEFLVEQGLVIDESGKLKMGPSFIHLESTSPNIPRHHQSWRTRAFLKYENFGKVDLAYTAPITLSKKDAIQIREQISKFISETLNVVKDSPSEDLFCLCVDWFQI